MLVDKYSIDGKVVGQVDLADDVFNGQVNDQLVYELIKAANANLHQGTHKVKTRREIRGGGIKPWRQKGTGRARQGTIRAPQWRGGGVVFGPIPRSYRIELPKAIKSNAYRSLFTLKCKQGSFKIVEDFKVSEGKTKEIAKILKNLKIESGLLITSSEDVLIKRAIRNIDKMLFNNVNRISSREVFYARGLIITESAVKSLNEKYSKGVK